MSADRAGYIAGLRELAGLLEQHPEIPLPFAGSTADAAKVSFGFHGYDPAKVRAELAAAVAALPCDLTPEIGDRWIDLKGQIGGLHIRLYASRDDVCTRRVTGIEVIDGKRVPVTEWTYQPDEGAQS